MPLRLAPARAETSGSSHVTARVRARAAGTAGRIAWACSIFNSVSSRTRGVGLQKCLGGARAGPGPRADVVRINPPTALRAGDDGVEHLAAVVVLEQHRPPTFVAHMGVAPAHKREQHR